MKILLIYPETPSTFWSFQHALKFISKRSAEPPLGLITVAALLPKKWKKRLIDMNVSHLKDTHILWADYVFLSGMNVHMESFQKVVKRCNELGVKVVAGGPMSTIEYRQFLGIDHFVLNEAEITLPLFIRDVMKGDPQPIYTSNEFPEISETVIPIWELLDMKKYASMSIQYSRGCPFHCEFCSVTLLNGHKPRAKSRAQFIRELDRLYELGWRSNISIVDDNFIGNKKHLKTVLLPALISWQEEHRYPFTFSTEASINLADDEQLIQQLVKAGLKTVFVGIETPNEDSLVECAKSQNLKRDLVDSVKILHRRGLIVYGGFIIGFDHDPHNIFERQIRFVQQSGIVTAMVGLLSAISGTRLFKRLKSEKRLLKLASGNNMDGSVNFIPKMNYQKLMAGYKSVLKTIYAHPNYYERVKTFLQEYNLPSHIKVKIRFQDILAFLRSIWVLGLLKRGRRQFWGLLFYTLKECPEKFALAVTLAIYGFHFRRVIDVI